MSIAVYSDATSAFRLSASSEQSAPAPSSSEGGVVHLVLTGYGSVIDLDSSLDVVPVDVADNLPDAVLVGQYGPGAEVAGWVT